MGAVPTVLLVRDGKEMRVNETEVDNYLAQGWKYKGVELSEEQKAVLEDVRPATEAEAKVALTEAGLEVPSTPDKPALVKMTKDGATVDVRQEDVPAREANGWTVVQ